MIALAKWDKARTAIAEARSVDEVKDIRDKAEAMRLYARQAGESLEVQNQIAEIKLRAERKAGELLKAMPKNEGGRPKETPDSVSGVSPTLKDIGIGYKQSERWQKIASVPEEVFEKHITDVQRSNDELTTASVLKTLNKAHVTYNGGENEWYTPKQAYARK